MARATGLGFGASSSSFLNGRQVGSRAEADVLVRLFCLHFSAFGYSELQPLVRNSDFGFLSDFGLRVSDLLWGFGFALGVALLAAFPLRWRWLRHESLHKWEVS